VGRVAPFEARDDPHQGFMDVDGQIFRGIEQSQKPLLVMPEAGSPD
jgi:hypothetical protein